MISQDILKLTYARLESILNVKINSSIFAEHNLDINNYSIDREEFTSFMAEQIFIIESDIAKLDTDSPEQKRQARKLADIRYCIKIIFTSIHYNLNYNLCKYQAAGFGDYNAKLKEFYGNALTYEERKSKWNVRNLKAIKSIEAKILNIDIDILAYCH